MDNPTPSRGRRWSSPRGTCERRLDVSRPDIVDRDTRHLPAVARRWGGLWRTAARDPGRNDPHHYGQLVPAFRPSPARSARGHRRNNVAFVDGRDGDAVGLPFLAKRSGLVKVNKCWVRVMPAPAGCHVPPSARSKSTRTASRR